MNKTLLIIMALLLLMSCTSLSQQPFHVEYWVTGTTSSVSLTYENKSGDTEQIASASVPWSLKFDAPPGQFLYVSAQNCRSSGNVTCQILINGVEQKTSTSQGGYVIATCSGSFR